MLELQSLAGGGVIFVIAAAALLALLAGHFALYLRAMRPVRGTLEWISMVDRPTLRLCAEPFTFGRADICCLTGLSLLAAASWAGPLLTVLSGLAYPGAAARLDALLRYFFAPVVSAQLLYLLLKRLSGNTRSSALAAAIFALDLSYGADTMTTPFALAAFLLVLLHLIYAGAFAPLIGAAAVLGVGGYFAPDALWQLALLYPVLLFVAIHRSAAGERNALWQLLGAALGFPAMTAAFFLLTQAPGAVLSGASLLSGDFFLHIALSALTTLLSALPQGGAMLVSPVEPLLLAYALLAALAALPCSVRRGQTELWLAIWLFAASSVLAIFGLCVPATGCMPVIALVWAQWEKRGGRWQVILASAFLLSTALAGRILQLLLGGI